MTAPSRLTATRAMHRKTVAIQGLKVVCRSPKMHGVGVLLVLKPGSRILNTYEANEAPRIAITCRWDGPVRAPLPGRKRSPVGGLCTRKVSQCDIADTLSCPLVFPTLIRYRAVGSTVRVQTCDFASIGTNAAVHPSLVLCLASSAEFALGLRETVGRQVLLQAIMSCGIPTEHVPSVGRPLTADKGD